MIGAAFAIAVLVAVAAIHFYWAGGGRFGSSAAVPERGGKPAFVPGKPATAFVGLALIAAAVLIGMRVGLVETSMAPGTVLVLVWLIAAIFAGRAVGDFRMVGFFKRASPSRFARLDTILYSPLCAVLALAIADAALEGH